MKNKKTKLENQYFLSNFPKKSMSYKHFLNKNKISFPTSGENNNFPHCCDGNKSTVAKSVSYKH